MSNVAGFESVYIGDLDEYISIDGINDDNQREYEEEELNKEWSSIGTVELMAERSLSPFLLGDRGILPSDWKWEVYRAKRYFRDLNSWKYLEPMLVRKLLSEGRTYAIRRYAKWEKIPFDAAMTAALPYGMRALLSQFFEEEHISLTHTQSQQLVKILHQAAESSHLIAYEKTALLQSIIHSIADDTWGSNGSSFLDKRRMRTILSLIRLHYSVAEMKNGGFGKFSDLEAMYRTRRQEVSRVQPTLPLFKSKFIKNWRFRHLRPLLFFYPFAFRNAITRGRLHILNIKNSGCRESVVNELALLCCALAIIKKKIRN